MTPAVLIPGTLCDERLFAPMAERLERPTPVSPALSRAVPTPVSPALSRAKASSLLFCREQQISPGPDQVRADGGFAAILAPPIAHPNVAAEADAILALAPPRFIAIGFSLGGFVVLELLRRAPERLLGAVLIASNAHPLQPGNAAARRADLALAERDGIDALIDRLWPRYVAPARRSDAALKSLVQAMARNVGVDRFARQTELAVSRPDSGETVRTTRVPLLALHGSEDAMTPPDRARSLGATILPGVGHFVPLEAPDAAAAAIHAWARELAPCC